MIRNPLRRAIVNAALAGVKAQASFNYAEIRPIPLDAFDALMDGKGGKVTTDCSGYATCCYHRAGAPDPNNQGYDGFGYTGTMLDTLRPIPLENAHPGDLAVFGAYPGKHVVVIVGTGSNPQCVSHGHQGDPHESALSTFESIGPVTVLQMKKPTILNRSGARHPKWRVTGDGGKVIGHVGRRQTRWMWEIRHRRLVAKQRGQLHYDRIHPHNQAKTTNPATR